MTRLRALSQKGAVCRSQQQFGCRGGRGTTFVLCLATEVAEIEGLGLREPVRNLPYPARDALVQGCHSWPQSGGRT